MVGSKWEAGREALFWVGSQNLPNFWVHGRTFSPGDTTTSPMLSSGADERIYGVNEDSCHVVVVGETDSAFDIATHMLR